MRLLLHHDGDPVAAWLARGLQERGRRLVSVRYSQLVRATRWEQRQRGAELRSEVVPAGVLPLRSGDLGVVLNRLATVTPDDLRIAASDRTYAATEMFALWLSWLSSLPCPVLNAASPAGLCGPWLPPAAWHANAARAGLPTDSVPIEPTAGGQLPTGGTVMLVACGAVFGPRPAAALADACGELAARVGAELLEVRLATGAGRFTFAGASVVPDLRRGGAPVLDHLARIVR